MMFLFKKFKGKRQASTLKLKDWGAGSVVVLVIAFLSVLLWILKFAADKGWIELPDWLYNLADRMSVYLGAIACIALGVVLLAFPLTVPFGISFLAAGIFVLGVELTATDEERAAMRARSNNPNINGQGITIEEPVI